MTVPMARLPPPPPSRSQPVIPEPNGEPTLHPFHCVMERQRSSRKHKQLNSYAVFMDIERFTKLMKEEFATSINALIGDAKTYRDNAEVQDEYFKRNVIRVTVYMETLNVDNFKQFLTYDFWTMLSDIGGTISFYIGGTLITFFEILIWCSEIYKRKNLISEEAMRNFRLDSLTGGLSTKRDVRTAAKKAEQRARSQSIASTLTVLHGSRI